MLLSNLGHPFKTSVQMPQVQQSFMRVELWEELSIFGGNHGYHAVVQLQPV
jgi:hypothetical protein